MSSALDSLPRRPGNNARLTDQPAPNAGMPVAVGTFHLPARRICCSFVGASIFALPLFAILTSCAGGSASGVRNQSSGTITPQTSGNSPITSNAGGYEVVFTLVPPKVPLNEPFEIRACVTAKAGSPTDAENLVISVDAAMPQHQHGMNTKPRIEQTGDGCIHAEGMLFHMVGRWELYFDITRNGITERAQTEIMLE